MIALDLFAGHGWGVACQRLGIEEYGVEIMPEAVATREANGMRTIYRDVWEGLEIPPDVLDAYEHCYENGPKYGHYTTLIASPPCQTFSMAGSGAGRAALDDVLEAIRERAYLDPAALRAFGEKHDPKTALVLTPLAHVARDTPMFVVFEQVPPVLPVWEACAEVMRRWGYSVWTGNLQAEMYGVPQTRKRAVLIARADGIKAAPPTPTHSRYYPRDPKRLDPGVKPWVSMAEALGWTPGAKVAHTRRSKTFTDGGRPDRADTTPAPTVTGHDGHPRGGFEFVSNQYTSATGDNYRRDGELPAPTITGGQRSARIEGAQVRLGQGEGRSERHGPRGGRPVADPAYTVLGGEGGNSQPGFGVAWGMTDRPYPTVAVGVERGGGTDPLAVGGSAARAIVYDARDRGAWVDERPATTIQGDSRVFEPGHKVNGADEARLGQDAARERYADRKGTNAERITVAEAAALQSYPAGFEFSGTKTKQFLQVGNAVPPLLAEAILKGFLS